MSLMHWRTKLQIGFAAATAILSGGVNGSEYTLTELTLGGKYSYAYGINNLGEVVGEAYLQSGNSRAFITGANGIGIRELGTFTAGNNSGARAINEYGQVVGYAELGGMPHAFITGYGGIGLTDLGTFGGDYSLGMGLNDYGQVVVTSTTLGSPPYNPSSQSFFTGPNGQGITQLSQPDSKYSYAHGINNQGQVIWEEDWGGFITGFGGSGRIPLGDLHVGYRSNSSTPYAINNSGQVVGNAIAGLPFSTQAFITGPSGTNMIELGTLGGNASYAYGINEIGQVVGLSGMPDGSDHAFVTGPNGMGMTDLNWFATLPNGGYLRYASGINDWGQIIATDNQNRSYLLTRIAESPALVSEPSTAALLALGLLGLRTIRRGNRVVF